MRYYGHAKSLGETPELDCVELNQPPRASHAPSHPRYHPHSLQPWYTAGDLCLFDVMWDFRTLQNVFNYVN